MKKYLVLILLAVAFTSCEKIIHEIKDHKNGDGKKEDILYFQTNDFRDNQNAILAYRHVEGGSCNNLVVLITPKVQV